MPDILTAAVTIFAGIVLYVCSQLFDRLVLDPAIAQKKLIGEIAHSLVYYANVYSSPGTQEKEKMQASSDAFRSQASALRASADLLRPGYCVRRIFRLPPQSRIIKASRELIGLSNVDSHDILVTGPQKAASIRQLLGIPAE